MTTSISKEKVPKLCITCKHALKKLEEEPCKSCYAARKGSGSATQWSRPNWELKKDDCEESR